MTKCGQTFDRSLRTKKSSIKVTKFYSLALIGCLVCLSLFVYLLEVNTIAAKGFKVRDLENGIQSVQDENEKLAMTVVELQATKNIDGRISGLGLVAVDKVEYLGEAGKTVAQR